MHNAVNEFIESLQREIERQEEQARFWERNELFRVEDITGTKLNKVERATKCRSWAQELRELIKSVSSSS